MKQDFHGNFRVNVTWFSAFFSHLHDRVVRIPVRFERSLHPAQVGEQNCPWSLKLMTSQVVEGTRIRKCGYGRLSGKWVNSDGCITKQDAMERTLRLSGCETDKL